MPWLRLSDTAAYDPIVVAVLEHPDADERTADEIFGYVVRLATLSAQHTTDYVATYATALSLAGTKARTDRLLALAEFAGYGVNEIDTETNRRRFRIIDQPTFIHMKTAEEVAWEAQRKTDNANPHIVVLVRMRDGDACRYCLRVVSWSDRTGGMGGTYDHRPPGVRATAETAVVACRSCNSARGAVGQGMTPQDALAAADEVRPLHEVPTTPYYKPSTRSWFAKHADVLAQHGLTPPPPAKSRKVVPAGTIAPGSPAPAPAPADADTAPQMVRPAAPSPGRTDPAPEQVRPEAPGQRPEGADLLFQQVEGLPELEIPGRDGTGRDGTGRAGTGGPRTPQARRRRRGRRGGKPKTSPSQQAQPLREQTR